MFFVQLSLYFIFPEHLADIETLIFILSFQSLWHIRLFRDEFLRRSTSEHVHVGDPCVVCALYEIFTALSNASADMRREAVAPTSLRIALSNLYPESNFFQEVFLENLIVSLASQTTFIFILKSSLAHKFIFIFKVGTNIIETYRLR